MTADPTGPHDDRAEEVDPMQGDARLCEATTGRRCEHRNHGWATKPAPDELVRAEAAHRRRIAAGPTGLRDDRERLAEALSELARRGSYGLRVLQSEQVADALMPIVDAIAEARATARARQELRDLADSIPCSDSEIEAKQMARDRADVLGQP